MKVKTKFTCPVCETEFDRVEKWGEAGDRCPRCKVPLLAKRQGEDEKNPQSVYLLDEGQVNEEGFIQVTMPNANPKIMRRVSGKGTIDFLVVYEGTLGTGRMSCPSCGGYLGQLTVFPGTTAETAVDAPRCQKTLRKEVDGRDGKCRQQTRFIYRHNPGGHMSSVPGIY